jgi:restriction endonuclease S subunit
MKTNWQTKKLGEICEIKGGKRVPRGYKLKNEATNYPYIRVADFNDYGSVDLGDMRYIDKNIYEQIKRYTISTKDLYISIAGTIGKTGIIPQELEGANLTENACKLVFNKNIYNKYIYYFTQTDEFIIQTELNTRKVAMPKLALTRLGNILIPIPESLDEQRRIVAVLDEVFLATATAKENAEKNLKNSRALFESYLQSIFSGKNDEWEEKKLGDKNLFQIIDGDRGKNYPNKSDFSPEGYCLFLNTKNVRPDGFDFQTTMFVTEKKDKALGNGKLQRNDVLLTTRGTIGNIAVYDETVPFENIRINSGMLIFRPNIKVILPEYLFSIFQSGIMKTQIKKYVSGAAQPQLPIKTLVNFSIPVSKSLPEQKAIVARLDSLSGETKKLEEIYRQKIADVDELKKSVLKKAFSGEL